MAYSLTQFENNTTNSLVALDNNFTTVSGQAPIPCTVSGSNSITLTQNGTGVVPSAALTQYTQGLVFTGIVASSNTAATQARVGTLALLNVYRDTSSGPVQLSGGELISGNAFSLQYDSALNSGNGGFHAITTTAVTTVLFGGNSTLTNLLSGTISITFTVAPGWTSQDQSFSLTAGLASALPAVGDFMLVNPPSVAGLGISYAGYVISTASLNASTSVASLNIRQINAASTSLASNSGVYRYAAIRTVP